MVKMKFNRTDLHFVNGNRLNQHSSLNSDYKDSNLNPIGYVCNRIPSFSTLGDSLYSYRPIGGFGRFTTNAAGAYQSSSPSTQAPARLFTDHHAAFSIYCRLTLIDNMAISPGMFYLITSTWALRHLGTWSAGSDSQWDGRTY